MKLTSLSEVIQPFNDLINPDEVAKDYGIPVTTQRVWKSTNRYGWAELTIKVGRSVRYRRSRIEQWLTDRTGIAE
ncbi:MAG: hypothetical protein ACLQHK_06625 [Gallionellaceae bacterium]